MFKKVLLVALTMTAFTNAFAQNIEKGMSLRCEKEARMAAETMVAFAAKNGSIKSLRVGDLTDASRLPGNSQGKAFTYLVPSGAIWGDYSIQITVDVNCHIDKVTWPVSPANY